MTVDDKVNEKEQDEKYQFKTSTLKKICRSTWNIVSALFGIFAIGVGALVIYCNRDSLSSGETKNTLVVDKVSYKITDIMPFIEDTTMWCGYALKIDKPPYCVEVPLSLYKIAEKGDKFNYLRWDYNIKPFRLCDSIAEYQFVSETTIQTYAPLNYKWQEQ